MSDTVSLLNNSGVLFIFTGPYGAGKTTLAQCIIESHFSLVELLVTFTTRAPRDNEVHERDYFFISAEAFNIYEKNNFFIEAVDLHGVCYGTPRHCYQSLINGKSFLMVLNRDGALFWKNKYPKCKIFWIDCLNDDIISERIVKRNGINNSLHAHNILSERVKKNKDDRNKELLNPVSDFIIINAERGKAIIEVNQIIQDLL